MEIEASKKVDHGRYLQFSHEEKFELEDWRWRQRRWDVVEVVKQTNEERSRKIISDCHSKQ